MQGPQLKVIKMYKIENGLIHGSSFALHVDRIEFLTWRLNEETEEFWVKLHTTSGKEIRLKVSEENLRDIVDWKYNDNYELKLGDKYDLDY